MAMPIYKQLLERFLDSRLVCAKLTLCNLPIIIKDSDSDYAKRVLADKPKVMRPKVEKNPEKYRILAVADLHLDDLYAEGSEADCGLPLCCRNTSDSLSSGSIKAGKWGTVGDCDLPPVRNSAFLTAIENFSIILRLR